MRRSRPLANLTRVGSAIALLALFLTLAPATGNASSGGVEVLPAGQKHYGFTYERLSSRWWAWALEAPADVNPVLGETGAFCAEGQRGRVWFLAGSFGGSAERTCAIPKRRALFVPLVTCWADNSGVPGSALPPTTFTEAELRALIAGCLTDAHDLRVAVDGEPVDSFRVDTGVVFAYAIPTNSLHDVLTARLATTCWLSRGVDTAGEFLAAESKGSGRRQAERQAGSISRHRDAGGTSSEPRSEFASSIGVDEAGCGVCGAA